MLTDVSTVPVRAVVRLCAGWYGHATTAVGADRGLYSLCVRVGCQPRCTQLNDFGNGARVSWINPREHVSRYERYERYERSLKLEPEGIRKKGIMEADHNTQTNCRQASFLGERCQGRVRGVSSSLCSVQTLVERRGLD